QMYIITELFKNYRTFTEISELPNFYNLSSMETPLKTNSLYKTFFSALNSTFSPQLIKKSDMNIIRTDMNIVCSCVNKMCSCVNNCCSCVNFGRPTLILLKVSYQILCLMVIG